MFSGNSGTATGHGVGTSRGCAASASLISNLSQDQTHSSNRGHKRLVRYLSAESSPKNADPERMVEGESRPVCFPAPPDGLVDFVLARPSVSHGALSVPLVADDTQLAGTDIERLVPLAKRVRPASVVPETTAMPVITASDWPLAPVAPFRGTSAEDLSTAMDLPFGSEGDWQATLCGGVASGAAESYITLGQLLSVEELPYGALLPQLSVDSPYMMTGDLARGEFQPGFDNLSLNSPPAPPPHKPLSPCDLGTFENTTFGLLPIY
jgi:hypothetical protein